MFSMGKRRQRECRGKLDRIHLGCSSDAALSNRSPPVRFFCGDFVFALFVSVDTKHRKHILPPARFALGPLKMRLAIYHLIRIN